MRRPRVAAVLAALAREALLVRAAERRRAPPVHPFSSTSEKHVTSRPATSGVPSGLVASMTDRAVADRSYNLAGGVCALDDGLQRRSRCTIEIHARPVAST